MKIQAAVIKEQGIKFVVVAVNKSTLTIPSIKAQILNYCSSLFPNMPVILATQSSKGVPTYFGREDIVNFLVDKEFLKLPWKGYEK